MAQEDIIAGIVGLAIAGLSLLSQVALWQRKEYRWDRMRAYLESPEGRLAEYPLLVLFAGCVGAGWLGFLLNRLVAATWFGWGALLSVAAYHAWRIRRQGVIRPQWTNKARLLAIVIVGLTGLYGYAFFRNIAPLSLNWATLIFFLPVIAAVATGLTNIPAVLVKQKIIARSQAKREELSQLTVIGVTGSWGKTSTKYFLQQLLAACGRNVAATREHRNSEFMVAQDMLEQLTKDVDIYIAEMGAYRPGEIAALVRLAKPNIGVITAIGNQHLDLFGSKENIARAKWELIEGLSPTGIAVLNADDLILRQRSRSLKRRVVWYGINNEADVRMTDVKIQPASIAATLWVADDSQKITVPVVSEAMLSSVLAAVAAAYAAGIPAEQIFKHLGSLAPYEHTMQIQTGKNGAVIIDDSYSASEASVLNALQHLARFPQPDKRVVMVPIIELGEEGPAVHERIGQQLRQLSAAVSIYGRSYKKDIMRGAGNSPQIQWITDPRQLVENVAQNLTAQSVILLEGRLPNILRRSLFQK